MADEHRFDDDSLDALERTPVADVDRRLAAALDSIRTEEVELLDPPAGTWEAIEAEVAADRPSTNAAFPGRRLAPTAERRAGHVVSLSSWRRPTTIALGAAAAVVLVVAGLLLVSGVRVGDDDRDEVAGSADLVFEPAFDPLGEAATARVDVVERAGDRVVEFTAADLPDASALAPGESLELWLLRPDADGAVVDLVSLGQVDPAAPGSAVVPAGVDLSEFALVDISVEPDDGDAGHSGRSILRGRLDA